MRRSSAFDEDSREVNIERRGRLEEKTFEKTMLDRQIKTETFLISFVLKSELREIALSRDNWYDNAYERSA